MSARPEPPPKGEGSVTCDPCLGTGLNGWATCKPCAGYGRVPDPGTTASADKIEALESELSEAVKVAYARGAVEWTRKNYPALYARLSNSNTTGGADD